jgi:hypothetical protein
LGLPADCFFLQDLYTFAHLCHLHEIEEAVPLDSAGQGAEMAVLLSGTRGRRAQDRILQPIQVDGGQIDTFI